MALPLLQVGAVLTNLVCTKVPILTRPHCYRDNADRYPHKFKCCPYDYVFVNYDRICSCVPKKYAQKLRNEQRYRQQTYSSPSYKKTGYSRVNNYGSGRSKNYGYAQKARKQSSYRLRPSRKPGKKTRYPVPSESISSSVKVTSINGRYAQNSKQVQFESNRRKAKSNSLRRKQQNVPSNRNSRQNNQRQQTRKALTNIRRSNVKLPKKTVSNIERDRVQMNAHILSSVKGHNRHAKRKLDNSGKRLIPYVKSTASTAAVKHRKDSQVKHIKPTGSTKTSVIKNAKSTKKNSLSAIRQRQFKDSVSKNKNLKKDVIEHSTQTLISASKPSQSSGNIPIYYLNYNLKNGVVVQMPVIYEYHEVLSPGIERAISLPGNKGFLVPISIYVSTSGRFVFNPAILRRHPSLLSHIRLAKQRGISIQPIPLRKDTTQSHELSTYLKSRSHHFDDILIDHPVTVDPLHDVVPLETHDHAPQTHFLGVDHGHIDFNGQLQTKERVIGFDNIQNQLQHASFSRVLTHPNFKSLLNVQKINTFTGNATLNRPLNRISTNPQPQRLRVLTNKDFVDTSSKIKQTFNPNWIPDLDLFQMLTNGQILAENNPTNLHPRNDIQKSFKNNRVDLHNIISNIPLDSRFDLKTNNLGRPLPDIPGPLSLRRQAQGKSHRLHFTDIHRGPVAFPSHNASPRRDLPKTLHLVNAIHPKIPESSVLLPSSGFANMNLTNSLISKVGNQQIGKFNPTSTNNILQKEHPLNQQTKVKLNFKGMNVKQPNSQRHSATFDHQLPNPLAGIAGSSNTITSVGSTMHTENGPVNIKVQSLTTGARNIPATLETSTGQPGNGNAIIKSNSNIYIDNVNKLFAGIGNNVGAIEMPLPRTDTSNSNLKNMFNGNISKLLDPISMIRDNIKTLKTTTGLTGTNSDIFIQNMIHDHTNNVPNPLTGKENTVVDINALLGGPATSSSNLQTSLHRQTGIIPNPLASVKNNALNINSLSGEPASSLSNLQPLEGRSGVVLNPLSGLENSALNLNILTGRPTTTSSGLQADLQGQTGSMPNPLASVENTVINMNSLTGGPVTSSSSLGTNLLGRAGSVPNPIGGMVKKDVKLDTLMGGSPSGSTTIQTNLKGHTVSTPNLLNGMENAAIKLNVMKGGSSSNSRNVQANLHEQSGHTPKPLAVVDNSTLNLNEVVGGLPVISTNIHGKTGHKPHPLAGLDNAALKNRLVHVGGPMDISTNLQTNLHEQTGHLPNPLDGIGAPEVNLNLLLGLPATSSTSSSGQTGYISNPLLGIGKTSAVKLNSLLDKPASSGSMELQTNLQRQTGSIPNPLAGMLRTTDKLSVLSGLAPIRSPKSETNVQGQSGHIPNTDAIIRNTAVKLHQQMRGPAEGSMKIQLDLQKQMPNIVSMIGNTAATKNRLTPVASSTKHQTKTGNAPNPLTVMDNTVVKIKKSNSQRGAGSIGDKQNTLQTSNPPNPLSLNIGNTAPEFKTIIGQPELNLAHFKTNFPRNSGNVQNILSGMENAAVIVENPIGQSKIGITNTLEHASRNHPQIAPTDPMNSGPIRLIDNSVRNKKRVFMQENVRMPIQTKTFKKMPFNPRLLAKQNPFTYRTFFNLSPNVPNTGSDPDRNGVIGIINGNTKIYPIPIFPGAINGKMGEPIFHQTDHGLDIFSGQEFSPFIDPTTNLPVGFTVKKFNNEVGGVIDLLQNNKSIVSGGRKAPSNRTKQPRKENGVPRLLQNDAVIKEIVTVLGRKKKPIGPNKNELFIPPEIIGEKSRNDIVMYLEDVKSSKSFPRKSSNDSVPTDLVKLLKNPVFVRYINNKTQETSPNTIDLSDPSKVGLIFDRISGSRKLAPVETKISSSSNPEESFTKSNTKVLNSKTKESVVFLTAKPVPPVIQKPNAEVLLPADPVSALPPVPVLKFDSIELSHQKPLKMNLTKDLCQGCVIDGGLGYANHPSNCERFVVCYPGEGGKLVPIEQQCPHGLFWSQNALTCRLPKDVMCPFDVCLKKKGKHQYPDKENCQSYWECKDGYSVPKCCPSGASFKEGQGCVRNDGSCKSRCPLGDSEIQPVFWQGECDRRAVSGSRNKFERHVYYQSNTGVPGRIQQEWMLQECSPGTEFHPEVCDCRVSGDLAAFNQRQQVCTPDVYLPFSHDLKDESSSRTHVRADNVSLTTSGSACFTGRSVLAMPKFANMELGSYLYVKLRYRHASSSPKNEVLVYNGDCERKPSLILGSTTDGNFVSVVTTSGEQHTLHVKSAVSASEWRTVSLVIDKGHIRVTSDSQTEQKNTFGVLERAPCGLKLGWGEGYDHFNGCIDEFTLYRCKPDGPIV